MELILIEGVLVVVPFISELTEETELMSFTWIFRAKVIVHTPAAESTPSAGESVIVKAPMERQIEQSAGGG
jgi:hypothetical protein